MNIDKRIENLENLVESLIGTINNSKSYTDADIAGVRKNITDLDSEMFPEWNPDGYDYYVSERVKYNSKLYRCIQNHKSQSDWAPGVAVSLWVEMSDPAEEWPEWKQPAGEHDAYKKGDKVTHLFRHWISDIDDNVWEPSVYGWTEQ